MGQDPLAGHQSRQWDPAAYWENYYGGDALPADEVQMFEFCVTALNLASTTYTSMIDVGCGPTVHRIAPFLRYVSAVDLADFETSNLSCIKDWIEQRERAFSWDKFFKLTGEFERRLDLDAPQEEYGAALRRKIRALHPCDVRQHRCGIPETEYSLVSTFLCLESVTIDKAEWQGNLRNVLSLLARGGRFFIASLIETEAYRLDGIDIACCPLSEHDLLTTLRLSLSSDTLTWRRIALNHEDLPIYETLGDILIATGVKC